MTQNVRKRMRSRSGNGSPLSVVSGIASAATSEIDAANAGEGQHERPLPGRRGVGAPDGGNEPARQVDRGKCPDEAGGDEDRGDQQRRGSELRDGIVPDFREDRARLKAGDQEQHALDQVDQEIPEENALQPGRRADQAEAVPAHVEADRHRRQHAGAAEMLRRPEGDVWRQDRKGDLDARVSDPAPEAQHQPADADPPHEFAGDDRAERDRRAAERKRPGAHCGHRETIEDERGGVVRQSLALEHEEDALGKLQPARDRQRRDRVGRRDDRAEQKADRPGQGQDELRGGGDGDRGENDASEREQGDRAQVETKFAPAHRDRRRIDDGRQHHQEHEFGRDFDRGQAWNQRENDAGRHQQNRGWNLEADGGDVDRGDHGQKQHQELDCRDHRILRLRVQGEPRGPVFLCARRSAKGRSPGDCQAAAMGAVVTMSRRSPEDRRSREEEARRSASSRAASGAPRCAASRHRRTGRRQPRDRSRRSCR